MFEIKYQGMRLILSYHATREMQYLGLDLEDVKEIVERGYQPRKRNPNTEEKWLNIGRKTYNVVISTVYNFFYEEEVWLIVHVGRFTRK